MKISSIIKTGFVGAAMFAATGAYAAPVAKYTLSAGIVSQKMTVSGCATVKSGGQSDVTFYRDDVTNLQTFTMTRSGPGAHDNLPDLTGTWSVVAGNKSYTVYMSPYNSSVGPDPLAPALPAPGIDVLLDALDVFAQANCSLKYQAAGNTVSINQPSVLVTKSVMTVANSDNSATLRFALKGKQQNSFKGSPKSGAFSSTVTIKGNVIKGPSCPVVGVCSIATVTM